MRGLGGGRRGQEQGGEQAERGEQRGEGPAAEGCERVRVGGGAGGRVGPEDEDCEERAGEEL